MKMADTAAIGLVKFTTPKRLIYVSLVEPRKSQLRAEPRFEVTFLLSEDDPDLLTARQTAADVAHAAFPGRDIATLKFPFKSGDQEAAKAEAKGKKNDVVKGFRLLQATSPDRLFTLSGLVNRRIVDFATEAEIKANAGLFYSGVEAYGAVRFKPYEGMGGGVNAYIVNVTSLGRGERIGGALKGSDAFGGYIGLVSDHNPLVANDLPI
jgi:hypothetical protein